MPSLSKTMIIGNVGQDVEMRFMPSGKPTSRFSVAVSKKWKDKDGEWKEETDWFNVSCFGDTAERANNNISKGDLVFAEGRVKLHKWVKDNIEHTSLDLIADRVMNLTKKPKTDKPEITEVDGKDIPF